MVCPLLMIIVTIVELKRRKLLIKCTCGYVYQPVIALEQYIMDIQQRVRNRFKQKGWILKKMDDWRSNFFPERIVLHFIIKDILKLETLIPN